MTVVLVRYKMMKNGLLCLLAGSRSRATTLIGRQLSYGCPHFIKVFILL